uniref:Uncharacterized protein n=1 Tax=Steinernema glaseri TaxID=37863 RepID=A0A1I7YBY4_9BILA
MSHESDLFQSDLLEGNNNKKGLVETTGDIWIGEEEAKQKGDVIMAFSFLRTEWKMEWPAATGFRVPSSAWFSHRRCSNGEEMDVELTGNPKIAAPTNCAKYLVFSTEIPEI